MQLRAAEYRSSEVNICRGNLNASCRNYSMQLINIICYVKLFSLVSEDMYLYIYIYIYTHTKGLSDLDSQNIVYILYVYIHTIRGCQTWTVRTVRHQKRAVTWF